MRIFSDCPSIRKQNYFTFQIHKKPTGPSERTYTYIPTPFSTVYFEEFDLSMACRKQRLYFHKFLEPETGNCLDYFLCGSLNININVLGRADNLKLFTELKS